MCSRPWVSTRKWVVGLFLHYRQVHGAGDLLELLTRGGAAHVGGDNHGTATFLGEPLAQFSGGGGFAGTLQPGEEDECRRTLGKLQRRCLLAQQRDQLVADNLQHLLVGGKRNQHVLAQRPLPDVVSQLLDDLKVDIAFEQRHANLPQRLVQVLFGELALAAHALEGGLQLVGQRLKHFRLLLCLPFSFRRRRGG
jgi:hypothetical protein